MEYYFEEDGTEEKAYGRLVSIFEHTIPWSKTAPETGYTTSVLVQVEWYSPIGPPNTLSRLVQVTRNHNFDNSGLSFLDDMWPVSFVLWREDAFDGASCNDNSGNDDDVVYNVVCI